jgi:hypothetical protein
MAAAAHADRVRPMPTDTLSTSPPCPCSGVDGRSKPHRLSKPHRRETPFLSCVPRVHPHRAAIEARFGRLLETLGPAWFLVVAPEPGGSWSVCLSRRANGRDVVRLWASTLPAADQNADALEPWLRALARRVQDELQMHVGLRPVGLVSPAVRQMLHTIVAFHEGGFTRDGHIVVPRRNRPALLDDVDRLGVRLEIGLWEDGRTIFAPVLKRPTRQS